MKKRKRNPDEVSPLIQEMAAGMDSFLAAMAAGEPIEKFTVRTTRLVVETRTYTAEDVKAVRLKLGTSQPILAKFLGVSVKALRSWEQGSRPTPTIAARFLDELQARPEMLTGRLQTVVG